MKSATDTEIKAWFEAAVATLRSVEGKDDEASKAIARDAQRELHTLRAKWNEVLEAKRRGCITDPACVNAVCKEITDSAKLAGLRIRLAIEPYQVEGFEFPLFHHVVVHRIGEMAEVDERRWVRWTEHVSDGLKVFPFVKPEHFKRTKFAWELTEEDKARAERKYQEFLALHAGWAEELDDEEDFEDEEEEYDEAEVEWASAGWALDTWVWNWPNAEMPTARCRRKPAASGNQSAPQPRKVGSRSPLV